LHTLEPLFQKGLKKASKKPQDKNPQAGLGQNITPLGEPARRPGPGLIE